MKVALKLREGGSKTPCTWLSRPGICSLYQTVLVKGNIRTFREYDRTMEQIAGQLQKGTKPEDMDPELLEAWKTILEILDRLFGKER